MPARTRLSEAEIQRSLREFKVSRGSLQYEDLEMVSMDPRLDDWSSFPVEHDSPLSLSCGSYLIGKEGVSPMTMGFPLVGCNQRV